jgi:CRP-like cAMP-binding protein
MTSLADQLSACPLFSRLTPSQLEGVAKSSRLMRFRAGELVFREGQPCEGFYVVAAGTVRVYKIAPDGRERTLHVVRPPHSLAEAAMFGNESQGYPAFAEAIEEAEVILVYREPFLRMLQTQPDCAVLMFESLARWLHRLLDQLETETFLNARAKLAHYLLREARKQGAFGRESGARVRSPARSGARVRSPARSGAQTPATGACRVELRLAKKGIASQLGMAPETFSRALADLESRGLIRPDGRRIEIPDAAMLESLLLGDAAE